jgi:hypothetical protein
MSRDPHVEEKRHRERSKEKDDARQFRAQYARHGGA